MYTLFNIVSAYLVIYFMDMVTAITGFIAMLLPFFGGLLGFFGGLVFSSTSYFVSDKPIRFHNLGVCVCVYREGERYIQLLIGYNQIINGCIGCQLPCIMWLIVKKPRWWSFHWFACWVSSPSSFYLFILYFLKFYLPQNLQKLIFNPPSVSLQ